MLKKFRLLGGVVFLGYFFLYPVFALDNDPDVTKEVTPDNIQGKTREIKNEKQEEDIDQDFNLEKTPEQNPGKNLIREADGKALRWKLESGDVVEIRKKSFQDIKITTPGNREKFLQSDHIQRLVLHRIVLNTISVENSKGYQEEASFNTLVNYKENSRGLYQEEESYESRFYIEPRGTFNVDPGTYMPNVRDVPVFPDDRDPNGHMEKRLKNGDTWEYQGMEVVKAGELEKIPLSVRYEYRGMEKIKDAKGYRKIHKILYNIEFNYKFKPSQNAENPKKMFGFVIAKLLWDETSGIPYYMTEDYDMVILYNNGISQEFKINSKTNYIKKKRIEPEVKEKIRQKLSEELNEFSKDKIQVRSDRKGISISIPDILFNTNSSQLYSESIKILRKVGQLLKKYRGQHQIIVRGHTDNVGEESYNKKLSEKRAQTVTAYLISHFDIPVDGISYEGVGSSSPTADNGTAQGRRKNRRVEIILLDN